MRTLQTLLFVLAALPAVAGEPVASELDRPLKLELVPAPVSSGPATAARTIARSAHRHDEQGAVIMETVIDPATGRTTIRKVHCTGHRFAAVVPLPIGDPKK